MFEILDNRELAPGIKLMEVKAPQIVAKIKPGQFVVLRIREKGERIPLTVASKHDDKGTLDIIYQEVGKTTEELGTLKSGDSLMDLVGPLGKPGHVKKYGTVVLIGGGVGIATLFPYIKAFKEAGNKVISVLGARTKELLVLEDDIKKLSDECHISTDDGSYGRKGFVTDVLKDLLKDKIDLVLSIGPLPMMKAVNGVTKPEGILTWVSLNTIMLDGTGMCGSCRLTVDGKVKFACVDGPEFEADKVDFDELMLRNNRFAREEALSLNEYHKKCIDV
ncbi:MAG: sulfide/dihydroorotate dehydrogenase-like FAD/NAD-binding protein [bacterium]